MNTWRSVADKAFIDSCSAVSSDWETVKGAKAVLSSQNRPSETRVYNDDNALATISYSGAPVGDLSYSWDANKNKTSESIGGIMSGYGFTAGYDAEDRVISWDRSDTNLDQSWELSPVGDWNSITENAADRLPARRVRGRTGTCLSRRPMTG